jgi:hypothetical protein
MEQLIFVAALSYAEDRCFHSFQFFHSNPLDLNFLANSNSHTYYRQKNYYGNVEFE